MDTYSENAESIERAVKKANKYSVWMSDGALSESGRSLSICGI